MNSYERPVISKLIKHLEEVPEKLIIVTGPRQTGKTTVLLQALKKVNRPHFYFPVDEPLSVSSSMSSDGYNVPTVASDESTFPITGKKDTKWIIRNWEQARIRASHSEQGFIIAFDEVQKIPNWSDTIKGLWDVDRRNNCPLHVVLLGSTPLLMQKGLSESLAGRFETIRLTHWSFAEMHEAFGFDLPSYIYFGGYPGAASFIHEQNRWKEYISSSLVEPNIDRDILAMRRVDKPALLKKLFELAAVYSGQILPYSKMIGQLQDAGNTTTLAHYLDLLSSAGLIAGLSKYAGSVHRRRASSPKLNVLNTALVSVYSGYTFEEAKADRSFWGHLVESAVGAHLFNTGMPEVRLYYWREKGHEVDFVLELGRRLVAFEVKSNTRKATIRGLGEFEKRFNPIRSELIGGHGISIEEFLHTPAKDWFKN